MKEPPRIIDQFLQNRMLRHLAFWVVATLASPLLAIALNQPFLSSLVIRLFYLPTQIIAAYLLIYYQLPKLLYAKKYIRFSGSILLSTYVLATLTHVLEDYALIPLFASTTEQCSFHEIFLDLNQSNAFYVIWLYLIPLTMASIKLIKQRFERKQAFAILQQEKAQAELNLLKAQVHPRFLSNTLKTLYHLSLQQADEAPEVIAKLSDMLDYMLYQSQEDRVALSKEVELIQTFLELETLKHGERMQLSFYPPTTSPQMKVAPLLLLSMVEDAFVYEQEKKEAPFGIQIHLQATDQQLTLAINSTQLRGQAEKDNNEVDIQRQLDLLYPQQYRLKREISTDHYQAQLTLDL